MIGAILKESFHFGFAKRLWAYFLILGIIGWILSMIANLPFNIVWNNIELEMQKSFFGTAVVRPDIASTIIDNSLQNIWNNLPALAGAFVVSFLLGLVVSSFQQGMVLNGTLSFLNGKRGISDLFSSSWQKTKPRIVTGFLVGLLLGIATLIVLGIAIAPIALQVIEAMQKASAENPLEAFSQIMVILNNLFLVIVALFALILLLSPVLALVYPVVFFEDHGTIGSIRRAIELGTRNYFRNLVFILALWLTILGSIIIIAIPTIALFFTVIGILLAVPLLIVYIFWLGAFSNTAIVKYYQMVF